MKMEYFDKLLIGVVIGALIFAAIVTYAVFIPESSTKVAREIEDAKRLGEIWGTIETAQNKCPTIVIDGSGAQKLLTQGARGGESSLMVMRRLSATEAWYEAFRKGEKSAQQIGKEKPGNAFCDAMMASYGPTGSIVENLLRIRAEGEGRPRFF